MTQRAMAPHPPQPRLPRSRLHRFSALSHARQHENDSGAQAALELAEEVEERGVFGGGVLVDAMEADEGIEHEEPGAQGIDGAAQAVTVGRAVEAKHRDGDAMDIEGIERDAGSRRDAGEALADHGERVLGREEEHGVR